MSSLIDPWDNFEPADHPPAPVRTIAITPEVLAADAAKQAARVPTNDWKIKATLSETNLHHNAKATRQAPVRQAPRDASKTAREPQEMNATPRPEEVKEMDAPSKAQPTRISISEIPAPAKAQRGRMGELWDNLLALPTGMCEVIENRNAQQCKDTQHNLRLKARGFGRTIVSHRRGLKLYAYLEPEQKA